MSVSPHKIMQVAPRTSCSVGVKLAKTEAMVYSGDVPMSPASRQLNVALSV